MFARASSLRQRRDDILPIARQFLAVAAKRFGKKGPALSPEAANLLLRYTWPGNVRELENALERALALAQSDRIGVDDLPPELGSAPPTVQTADDVRTLAEMERDYIAAAFAFYNNQGVTDFDQRTAAYSNAMEKVYRAYPKDHEADAFYALSLLASAPPRDPTFANQKKAIAILRTLVDERLIRMVTPEERR